MTIQKSSLQRMLQQANNDNHQHDHSGGVSVDSDNYSHSLLL